MDEPVATEMWLEIERVLKNTEVHHAAHDPFGTSHRIVLPRVHM